MDLAKIEDLTASSSDSSYAHLYWSDSSCLDLVTVSYPHHLPLYTSFPHNIQRIDACRYFILDMYGGIYADTDVSLHDFPSDKPFPDKLSNVLPSGVGLIESPYKYNEEMQNSLVVSERGHPFWREVVFKLMEERGGVGSVLYTTGPILVSDAVMIWKEGDSEGLASGSGGLERDSVGMLPCENYQRIPRGDWDTTFLNVLAREVLTRLVPMKSCGKFAGECEVTRHWGKASWVASAGFK